MPLGLKALAALIILTTIFFLIKNFPTIINQLEKLTLAPKKAISLLQDPETILKTTQRRTNILLLGKGGASHETPDLTDTIIFFSYHHPSGTSLMLSLPRDIWIDTLKAKLNTAYHYGNLKQPESGGLILAQAAVEEVIDQPVHYTIAVDFDAFISAIDLLGGIEVDVIREFNDYKYPIPGKENALPEEDRYEHLHFDSGLQTLDGQTALKFARSRYADSEEEGTDYARILRQQQVLLAFQKKALSTQLLLSPKKISELTNLIHGSIDTDATDTDVVGFTKLAAKFDQNKLATITLDQGDKETDTDGLLIQPSPAKYNNQWVLTGRDGSWQEVQQYISNLLKL